MASAPSTLKSTPYARGRIAPRKRFVHLRALPENGFFFARGVLAVKELRKRAIFFLQKRLNLFGVTEICITFAFAISKKVR